MKLEGVELRRVSLPLVSPFRTSLGTSTVRTALLVRVVTDQGDGWGECVVGPDPYYTSEYLDGVADLWRRYLLPALFAVDDLDPAAVGHVLSRIRGHVMAKSAIEMAVLDVWLRAAGLSLRDYLGGTRTSVPVGVSIGIADSIDALLETVDRNLSAGYQRIKLKIEPGWDLAPVRAVREAFGSDVMLTVDANTAYQLGDLPLLRRFDEFDLAMIEQPFAPDDLHAHAVLAERLHTPICLDESITSASDAANAIRLGACSIINVKPGRVGGYLEARRIHDVAIANGVPVWCGGMLETGLGRAGNLALAALPGFTLPGDISATARYYVQDITDPFVITGDGEMSVPTGPGLGVNIDSAALAELTISTEWLSAPGRPTGPRSGSAK